MELQPGLSAVFGSYKAVGYSACVLRQGRLAFAGGGLTRKRGGGLPDARSIFEIGSLTKLFTALLLDDMRSRGEVGLDEPVNRYLPSGVRAPSLGGKEVTLLDLASQSSGLPRMPPFNYRSVLDGQHPYSHLSVKDAYRFLGEAELQFPPGSKYLYSNFGYGLLGHALELAAGRPYRELVASRICGPLGMRDTGFELDSERRERLCQGYSNRGRPKTHMKLNFLAPAGGLTSTVEDLARFLGAAASDSAGGIAGLIADCQAVRREWPPETVARFKTVPGLESLQAAGVGLAWHVYRLGGKAVAWHTGGTTGFSSYLGLTKEPKAGVVFLANSNGDANQVGLRAMGIASS